MNKQTYRDVDAYIGTFPTDVQEKLRKIRRTITMAAPQAEEVISYQMPAYKHHGMLVYFAAFKDHYSLFIPPHGVFEMFKQELKPYYVHKATIHFPKSEPIPFDLIHKIVRCAVEQNEQRAANKDKKKEY